MRSEIKCGSIHEFAITFKVQKIASSPTTIKTITHSEHKGPIKSQQNHYPSTT